MPYQNEQLDQYIQKADKLRNDFRKQVESIKSNDELSTTGKQNKIDELHESVTESIKEHRQNFHADVTEIRSELEGRAFDISGSQAEQMAFDSLVYDLTQKDVKPKERQARLQQGSDITALAVAKASLVKGDSATLNQYGEKHPDKAEPISELLEFERRYGNQKSAKNKFTDGMAFGSPKRPEVSRSAAFK